MASVTQALDSLLPSQSHPPKLVQLANSLLAQSRNKAANLKQEEEIARPYACAELACNRLRVQLRLPPSVKSRPPCKPAVYKKLIGFLEGVLSTQKKATVEQASSTPKKRTANGLVKSAPSTPTSSSKTKNAFAGKVLTERRDQSKGDAPEWVMPLIRKLCKVFETPLMPPHVYTGVSVVLKLAELRPQDPGDEILAEEFKRTVSALTIAIYLLVLTRMQVGDMTTEAYTWKCGRSIEITELGETGKGKEMVEAWIKRLDREGWCSEQDWWGSVPEGVMEVRDTVDGAHGLGGALEEDDVVANKRRRSRKMQDAPERVEDDPDGVLLPGLGTMMQDAVDWLSGERRLEYIPWKESMLSKIRMIEQEGGKKVAVR